MLVEKVTVSNSVFLTISAHDLHKMACEKKDAHITIKLLKAGARYAKIGINASGLVKIEREKASGINVALHTAAPGFPSPPVTTAEPL